MIKNRFLVSKGYIREASIRRGIELILSSAQ
jgi:hypothetical protein